jgi:hypothetical protein
MINNPGVPPKQSGMGVAKRQKSAPKKPALNKRVVLSADKLDIGTRTASRTDDNFEIGCRHLFGSSLATA